MNKKKVSIREEEGQNIEKKMIHVYMGITDVIPMTGFCKAVSRTLMKNKGYTSAMRI